MFIPLSPLAYAEIWYTFLTMKSALWYLPTVYSIPSTTPVLFVSHSRALPCFLLVSVIYGVTVDGIPS